MAPPSVGKSHMAPKPDKKKKPAQTSTEASQMLVVKCSRSTLEALILKSVLNAAPITLAATGSDLEATPVPSVPDSPPRGPGEVTEVGSSRHGSISGRELSFVSDAAREFAVGYHAAPFVAGLRAGAWRQWGSARSRFKRTVRVRSQFTGNRV